MVTYEHSACYIISASGYYFVVSDKGDGGGQMKRGDSH